MRIHIRHHQIHLESTGLEWHRIWKGEDGSSLARAAPKLSSSKKELPKKERNLHEVREVRDLGGS